MSILDVGASSAAYVAHPAGLHARRGALGAAPQPLRRLPLGPTVRRKVTGLMEVPYDRFPDGKPKTHHVYMLECGHTVQAGIQQGRYSTPIEDAVTRNCKKCPKESS